MRRAFLDLDTDYDGFLTEYELSRFLGSDVNLNDLKLLMQLRDTKGEGKIDFTQFCCWFGPTLEPCEGFYFRHDSVQNPEEILRRQA